MMLRLIFMLALAFVVPAPSHAQETSSQSKVSSWDSQFDTAYDNLVLGRFEAAATGFEALVASAPDEAKRGRVKLLAGLARNWAKRGYTLVLGSQSVESAQARAERRRTTGEIAGLYADSVLYGLGTGIWVSSLVEVDSAAGIILPALALAGASAGIVYKLDDPHLAYGVARSASTGLHLGLLEGLSFVIWNESRSGGGLDAKVNTSLIWATTTLGAVGGGILGQRLGATPGAASMVETGAIWTALTTGLLTYGALGDSVDEDVFFLASALGLNIGAVGAGFLAADQSPSVARVRYLDLGALSGGVLFGGLFVAFADLADSKDGQLASLVTAVGIGAGAATAWVLTKDMTKDAFVDRSTVSWTPTLLPHQDGLSLGVVGTF